MSIRVTLSANAGVAIEIGGTRIWVDALHNTHIPGFSTLNDRQGQQLWAADTFQSPDAIIYTHCHPDHYSLPLTKEARRRWPNARLFLPQKDFEEQDLISGDEYTAIAGDTVLHFYRLPHEMQNYTYDVPHYGLTISCGAEVLLLPGDCAVASPNLLPAIKQHPHLALLNFPWITRKTGRDFIEQQICPKHILVYHLPFAADDTANYRTAAELSVGQMPNNRCIHLLDNYLQTFVVA